MEKMKRKCFTLDKQTEELIDKILAYSKVSTASELIRVLIEGEAVRLGIISSDVAPTKMDDTDFTELYKKFSMLLTIAKSADDKLYCLLDSFNNFLVYIEPEKTVPYRSMDTELNNSNSENIHSYLKHSQRNLDEKKHRATLNK